MTLLVMLVGAIVVGTLAGVVVARRKFDALTRQRDGVFFHPFDECWIDRFSGVVSARMWVAKEVMPDYGATYMMSINGIMTEMRVMNTTWEWGHPLAEVELRDARSAMARAYGSQ